MSGPSSHAAGVGSVAGSPRDAISGLKANVMVCARVRPLFGCGAEGTAQCVITASDKKRIVLEDPRHRELPKEFLFDHVFDSSVTTSTIFKTHVARGIDAAVLSHVPCTVFAHGASGSGKTFTMQVKEPGGLFPQGLAYGRLVYRGRELADLSPTSGLAKIEALETRLNMQSLLISELIPAMADCHHGSAMLRLSEIDSPLGALYLIHQVQEGYMSEAAEGEIELPNELLKQLSVESAFDIEGDR
ncbi:Kinesin-like protein kif22 [Perkinsus olseni]|uniref:Kinesin-like protein kif22 n=1 Tax=Perkinsus olseni TaxID=32597 RepID=A0A7J6RME2_PEROL|nr:Kinesin-like protein kif22 [Perkinsus olseni]KAF4721382.1 Kinesin-like protein kif22 [Perkinsus olseni]